MSVAILSAHSMANLEAAALADGATLSSLIQTAVMRAYLRFQSLYPATAHPNVALLVGKGHNGCDALGIGCELLREKRHVIALFVGVVSDAKPETARKIEEFLSCGGELEVWPPTVDAKRCSASIRASVWIDGLFGFGLNREPSGTNAAAIRFVNAQRCDVVALDIPSGLSCDAGVLGPCHIQATHTFVMGAYKPAHVGDDCVNALGELHCLDLNLGHLRGKIDAPDWIALESSDLLPLLPTFRRRAASHKGLNGRLLVIAGSARYPGAGVLACLGASVSGAGLIHALVPPESRRALLVQQPEIIFESRMPDPSQFDCIVAGPGWVPAQETLLRTIIEHAKTSKHLRVVLDAGSFPYVKRFLEQGHVLSPNIILTPHAGEFARMFPSVAERMEAQDPHLKVNRLEAAAWAASLSAAHIILKGARSHIASPDGTVASVTRSSPLLAHAGQGDVFAGLLGGLCALSQDTKKAAYLAALLQAEVALQFSSNHPFALTLQPSELVRQLQRLPLMGR